MGSFGFPFLEGVIPRPGTRRRTALRRLLLSAALGVVALTGSVVLGASLSVGAAVGWDLAALSFLVSVWAFAIRFDADATARVARTEDGSRAVADAALIAASVASLLGVAFILVDASARSGSTKGLYIALAVSAVIAAWAVVHTVYTLRYARLYYSSPPGGIDFHADDQPDYLDFAYVALTIGMTFQVSDTDLTAKRIRRAAVRHALLSYLFGAVIVAITINIVGTLAGG
jgi:uncharacterized membrane protein